MHSAVFLCGWQVNDAAEENGEKLTIESEARWGSATFIFDTLFDAIAVKTFMMESLNLFFIQMQVLDRRI